MYDSRKSKLMIVTASRWMSCLGAGAERWGGQEGVEKRDHIGHFGGGGCVHYYDCSDDFIGICICPTYKIMHLKNIQFLYTGILQ